MFTLFTPKIEKSPSSSVGAPHIDQPSVWGLRRAIKEARKDIAPALPEQNIEANLAAGLLLGSMVSSRLPVFACLFSFLVSSVSFLVGLTVGPALCSIVKAGWS